MDRDIYSQSDLGTTINAADILDDESHPHVPLNTSQQIQYENKYTSPGEIKTTIF